MADILLIHGAWHGPWCWQDFAARLDAAGHNVRVVALRGHDGSSGRRRIWHRVRDYIEDVEQAVAGFAAPPILVGHSLGGLLVQKYLEGKPAPGAVLMASIPPAGTLNVCLRLLRRHPGTFLKANLLLSLQPFVSDPQIVRELFFTVDRPDTAGRYMPRLQNESYFAFLDTLLFALPRPAKVRVPVLVLGAEYDGLITTREVEQTAAAYGTTAEIFPGIGHDMMLDRGWEAVADRVGRWARCL